MDDDTIMYLALSSFITPALVFANQTQFGSGIFPTIAIMMALLGAALIAMMALIDYIIFPLITGLLGITFEPSKDYKITKSQDAVVKNVNGLYYSTGYITANLFAHVFKAEMIIEGEEEKQRQAPDSWERAVMSVDFPFKFHVIASGLDIQAFRDELEGKRSYQEFQMNKAAQGKNVTETILSDIQRNINVIQAKMDRITQEEKPIGALMYVETTSVGVSERASLDTLADQIRRLQIALGSFDVALQRVVGRELYTLFQFNFALPSTYQAFATNFDKMS